jgi:glycerol-3-phosphate acyltransferase PlsX
MKIGIDIYGGDHAPDAIIDGLMQALDHIESDIYLYGKTDEIKNILKSNTINQQRITIVHTTEVITNLDKPVYAVKRKKDSSMIKGLMDLKDNKIDAFLSAGNSGVLLAGGLLRVGRLKGIDRPALTIPYPTKKGMKVLLDAGANAECKPRNMNEFSMMGSIYAEEIFNIDNPTVGLVSNGEEKTKGNKLVQDSYDLLNENDQINFIGNIEGRDISSGTADVIVTDGFTGNVILKLSEGVATTLTDLLKEMFKRNIFTKLAALIVKKGFSKLKKLMDYTEYGGAPLLGVDGLVVKAHGSSNAKAFKNAIIYTEKALKADIVNKIKAKIS